MYLEARLNHLSDQDKYILTYKNFIYLFIMAEIIIFEIFFKLKKESVRL